MAIRASSPLRFGAFEFDPASGDLRKHGLHVRLTPQARELMRMFAEAPNEIHSRDEIQQRLWPSDTYVDFEHGVNKVAHLLREALGESARNPRFIETVAAEGYRFICDSSAQASAEPKPHSTGSIERIAVLPLRTDANAELESMGKVIMWHLTANLAGISGIRTMADSTVRCRNIENMNPQQAGACLGVEAVFVGELTKQNGQLTLRCELVDATDGALVGCALIERSWQPGTRCEKELAAEACRRMRHFLADLPKPQVLAQNATLPEQSERVSCPSAARVFDGAHRQKSRSHGDNSALELSEAG